jgi:hypothetical protein
VRFTSHDTFNDIPFGGKVLTQGKNIPDNAIIGGTDTDGSQLWVARAYYDGGIRKIT